MQDGPFKSPRQHGADNSLLRQLQKEFSARAVDPAWQLTKRKRLVRPFSHGDVDFNPLEKAGSYQSVAAKLHQQIEGDKPWFLIDPEGWFSRFWNINAVILIYMLLFYLPFVVAYFDEPAHCNYLSLRPGSRELHGGIPGHVYNRGWQVFPVFTNAFFLADIIVNLLTGFEDKEGNKDYSLTAITKRYLVLWFWVDAVSCIPLECIFYTAFPRVYWYNIPKFIRLLRLAGIKRRSQGSPFRFIDKVSDLRQEFSFSARRIFVAAFYIFVVVHWFACTLWWTIRLQDYPSDTWPSQLNIAHGSVMEQWLFSVFSIVSGMIGLGYGSYPPVTWGEALVWTFAMLTTASMFAVVNGFIIATILSSASSRHRYKERMDMIVETTHTHDLPEALRQRIIAYFKYKYRDGKLRNQEAVLQELPYDMQAEVALQSAGPLLEKVSLISEEPTLMERVALVLHPSYALKGEQILKQGWPGRSMYFVRSGFIDLIMDGAVVDTVQPGDFFGEVALLSLPPTSELLEVCGHAAEDISNYRELFPSIFTAQALTNCDMFTLEAKEFHQLVEEYPKVKVKLHAWAVRHAQRLLKYGFVLGPQFNSDSNLPPDEADSVPATIRRNAPSNVILNIADLRNTMNEAAAEEQQEGGSQDGELQLVDVDTEVAVQQAGQAAGGPYDEQDSANDGYSQHHPHVLHMQQGDNQSEGAVRSEHTQQQSEYGYASEPGIEMSQHAGALMLPSQSQQMNTDAHALNTGQQRPVENTYSQVSGQGHDALATPTEEQLQQLSERLARQRSAVRGSRPRLQLSSVRFAEDSDPTG